ncbi:MAG TPA: DegQ family serine endoprotease [Burkholderiales bacterium]|nr:DegQ family serine endoprotease [Burkholderiales bacterium]
MKFRKLALALAVGGALSAGGVAAYEWSSPAIAATAAAPAPRQAASALPDFSALVDRYGPAVVNISVVQKVKTSTSGPEGDPLGLLRRFGAPMPGRAAPMHGQGSGFIVSPDGVVLTNAHVVDGAAQVTVKLTDRREFSAKVIGKDPQTDVAVLKIDAKNLPVVKLGDARTLRPGAWVVAIGSPFGFENSVTAGVVSAVGRSLPDESYVPFIQTDAAVNPGNSGGPLFNLAGEVVGINSQILSQTGGYQGLSFAIPIDVALNVKDQILARGHVTRGWLGVTIQAVTQPLAQSFGLEKPAGALVSAVEPGGPAAKAGLNAGDVIVAIDGTSIGDSGELPARIGATKPGTPVRLDVWRNGASHRLSVAVGESKTATAGSTKSAQAAPGHLGLALRALTPQERRDARADSGLLVEQSSGAAAEAGIQPGDVLLSVNGTPLRSAGQLRTLAAKKGSPIALLVQRGEERLFVPVSPGA